MTDKNEKDNVDLLKKRATASYSEPPEKTEPKEVEDKAEVKGPEKPVKESRMYYSKSPQHRIGADQIQPEVRNQVTGSVIIPSAVITFYGNIYKTENPEEMKLIEATKEFMQGKIKIITMAEYVAIQKSKNIMHKVQSSDLNEVNKIRDTVGG